VFLLIRLWNFNTFGEQDRDYTHFLLLSTPSNPDSKLYSTLSFQNSFAWLYKLTLHATHLELMGAVIASQLAYFILSAFNIHISVILWSDSQIVLHWLHSSNA